MTILVGGVSQLFQGDLDVGRRAVLQLEDLDLGADVLVEDLFYGALAVAQRLEELRPDVFVLVGAERRGRAPGTVERRRVEPAEVTPAEFQASVADAGTGWVSIDLLVTVAAGLRALPSRTVAFEIEPVTVAPSEQLSPQVADALERAVEHVRAEVGRAPLLGLARDVRASLADGHATDASALEALEGLLDSLDLLDREGRWGSAFRERDRLRLSIAAGGTGEGMTHEDWALWWTLIEELDRLQSAEGEVATRR